MKYFKKYQTLFLILLIIAGLAGAASGGFVLSKYYNFKLLKRIITEVKDNYVEEISEQELVKAGVKEIIKKLDPYTSLYDPDNIDQLDVLIKGTYGGIGVEVKKIDSLYTVIVVDENMPAAEAGIKVGDVVNAINHIPLKEHSHERTLRMIRGVSGTSVDITVFRPATGEMISKSLKRAVINVKDVELYNIDDNGIGYIKLKHFSQKAPEEFRKALEDLKRKNVKGLIIDLRGNSGGLLNSAVRIVDYFVDRGMLVTYTRGRKRSFSRDYRSEKDPIIDDIPLALLVDGGTASASEIVSGAIQDMDRGILLGTRTFGKGLVQTVIYTEKEMILKITTAKYFTPGGRSIQKDGSLSEYAREREKYFQGPVVDKQTEKGLQPDVRSVIDPSKLAKDLIKNNIIFQFALDYLKRNPEINIEYLDENQISDQFYNFICSQKYFKDVKGKKEIQALESQGKNGNYPDKYFSWIDSVKSVVSPRITKIELEEKAIKYSIKKEIYGIVSGRIKMLEWISREDPDVLLAKEYLSDKNQYMDVIHNRNRTEITKEK